MNSAKAKKNKIKNKNKRKRRQLQRTTRNKLMRQYNRLNRIRMPAAYTKSFSKFFKIVKQDGNSMTVRGRDLVYSIPDNLIATYQDTNIITIIPCNPCYWLGTRIAAIANGYQNYRPLKFTVNYIPQCAVTQQGNVISGTLWNQTPSSANLQQTLRTSSGGMLTQCYKTATSDVSMQSNLQFNLFRCAGKFDQESNPFNFISIAVGCLDANNNKIIPGYFYVSWEYTFKNPIGYSTQFLNSGLKQLKDIDLNNANVTLVACQSVAEKKIEVGMVIQCDIVNNTFVFTYNNTELAITPADPLLCWSFQNRPLSGSEIYDLLETEVLYTAKYTSTGSPVGLNQGTAICTLNEQDELTTYLGIKDNGNLTLPPGTVMYALGTDLVHQYDMGQFVDYFQDDNEIQHAIFRYIPQNNETIILISESDASTRKSLKDKIKKIL